jgi:class 3 adenylate cyclase
MFSETRYALNGELRVAYRASREGPRDIVFVSNWFTNCEVAPELLSIQGWVEAMTSLGRMIFFDQPGSGASDPVAEHIPGSKYVELPGRNMWHCVEPWRSSFREVAEFLTGQQPEEVVDDRVLATVLFTDIVDSTRRAAEVGDRDWHALLDAHDAVVRVQLNRFRGREVNTSGDGFLAMIDGPQRAIGCAMAIRDAVQALGIQVRAGLDTGECEVRGDDIGGIGVHIGARVSALAGPNDVLVSSTLRDLVIGSGLDFEGRGAHQLKGVPGEWRLFAVTSP